MHWICHYFQFDLRSQWKKQPVRLLNMVPPAEMQCESHSCPLYSITVWKMRSDKWIKQRRCEKCIDIILTYCLYAAVICLVLFDVGHLVFWNWLLDSRNPSRSFDGFLVCLHTQCIRLFLIIGSRPSDHYFRSVCLFVYLFVCLFVQSFSPPSLIRFRSN